ALLRSAAKRADRLSALHGRAAQTATLFFEPLQLAQGQRPCTSQPRASEARAPPWVSHGKKDQALKGRPHLATPLQGLVHSSHGSQGGVRVRRGLALGWLVSGLWPEFSPLLPKCMTRSRTGARPAHGN